jgi:hypothetical protein
MPNPSERAPRTEPSPLLLWAGAVLIGIAATGASAGAGFLLLFIAGMSYDSPARSAESGALALSALLAGLGLVALAGWILGLALPFHKRRKPLLAVGGAALLLGIVGTLLGLGVALSGLSW